MGTAVIISATRSTAREASRHSTHAAHIGARTTAVHLGINRMHNLLQLLLLRLKLLGGSVLVLVEPLGDLIDLLLDFGFVSLIELVLELRVIQRGLHAVSKGLELVLRLDALRLGLILSAVLLSILDHLFNLIFAQTALVVGNGDVLLVAVGLVLGSDVQNAVGIQLELDLDLRDTTRSRRDARQIELAQQVVVGSAGTLALVHLNGDSGLVVCVRCEHLALADRNRSVTLNDLGHDTACRLNTQRQWRNVNEENVFCHLALVAGKNGSLHGSAVSNGLVGVDRLARLLATKELADELLHLRDTSGTTDQDDLINRLLVNARVLQHLLHGG